MAAGASTCNQNTALIWLKAIGMLFYVLLASLIVFLVFKYLTWNWGIISLFVTVLVFTLIFFDRDYLKFGLFVLFTLYLATDFPVGIYRLLGSKEVIAVIRNSAILTFLLDGPNLRVVWSVVLGFIGALLVTLIPILFFSLISGVFILALHRIEGVSWWDATKYITSLLLGINLPFIVVENGQALLTKEASKLGVIGGPGHLIVKHGNVVVLECGGKISRIVNAGVTKLKTLETIRNIFVLGPQSNSVEIEDIITQDRIPLKITLKMVYQIEPASATNERLGREPLVTEGNKCRRFAAWIRTQWRKLCILLCILEEEDFLFDDGLYQVYESNIRKIALTSQATSLTKREVKKCCEEFCYDIEETDWKKAAGGVPEGELRDHILSHHFNELFELAPGVPGVPLELRANRRKIYEIEQAILRQITPGKINNLGVLVRNVDIVTIAPPPKLRTAIIERLSSNERASGQADAITSIGTVKTDTIAQLLDTVLTLITTKLPTANDDIVRKFLENLQSMYQRALIDDVLIKDIVEANSDALGKLAESEGPKLISTGMLMDPSQLLPSQVKVNGK